MNSNEEKQQPLGQLGGLAERERERERGGGGGDRDDEIMTTKKFSEIMTVK